MRSFRTQILLLLVATAVITSLMILLNVWVNTSAYVKDQVSRSTEVATNSFLQLLDSREEQLINSAILLTSDFGFKQAVASQDVATIASALANHGDRVRADIMFLTNLSGKLLASTHAGLEVQKPFSHPELIAQAAAQGGALSFIRVGNSLYQIAIVSVDAPVPIAFTGVGYRLNLAAAQELKLLTNVDVTFIVNGETERQTITTLPQAVVADVLSATEALDSVLALPFAESISHITTRIDLETAEPAVGDAYLSVPIGPQLAEFRTLRDGILWVSLAVVVIAILASLRYSIYVSGPLLDLVGVARRMARGDYSRARKGDGSTLEIKALFSAVGQMGEDIQERESRIRFQAQHDNLTGLLNRSSMNDRLENWLTTHNQHSVIACLNIRGFKTVNDSFGPDIGDLALVKVGERLKETHEETDLVGRFSGDEFVFAAQLAPEQTAESVIAGLLHRLQTPMVVRELTLTLQFAVGYAVSPLHGRNATDVLRRATIALDKARQEQKSIRSYVEGEDEEHIRSLKLIRDLRLALEIDDGQLFMNYQPKMNLAGNRVDKFEALIRWIHPEDGFVSPEMFIALAEQSNLIATLTDWVVGQVIKDRTGWQDAFPNLQIAINVSAQDLERTDLMPRVIEQLDAASLSRSSLCFEMTERDMMTNPDHAIGLMQKYRDAGFDLSVDDYGIGQSSLSKLKQMPVTEVKIDKLFITELDSTPDDEVIVRSTIKLGHDFGLRVIAEGVETAAATAMLREMGCDYIQGYFLSRPIKAEEVAGWLESFSFEELDVAATG